MPTAAWPLQVALATALAEDAPLVALLTVPGLHNGVAPEGTPLTTGSVAGGDYRDGYVILGEPTEGRFDALMQPGNDGTLALHVYTADESNATALAIYARLVAVLDGVPLALTGHAMLRGAVTLERAFRDPAGGRHLVARYRALTRAAA